MPSTQAPVRICGVPIKKVVTKTVIFIVMAAIFGWVYAWASPKVFPKEASPGFGYGMVHGALMPMALPSLVMGNNVDIFAANNSGRLYKIGYIVGINLCGIVFFGPMFWRPAKNVKATSSDKSQ